MAHTGAQLSGSGAQLSGSGAQLSAISAYLHSHTSYLGAGRSCPPAKKASDCCTNKNTRTLGAGQGLTSSGICCTDDILKSLFRLKFKYLKFLVKLHHASVAGYCTGYCQSAFCFQEVKSISKSPKKWLINRSFSFHKAHFFSSECELMLKKLRAMIDNILMLLLYRRSSVHAKISVYVLSTKGP